MRPTHSFSSRTQSVNTSKTRNKEHSHHKNGSQVLYFQLLGYAIPWDFLLGDETFEVEQSLPHQQCKLRGAHQAVVVRHGHPLLPLPLHLHQDLWLSWHAACEELPGVFHFPGPWLIEGGQPLQDCKDFYDPNHQVNCNVPYNCQVWT